MISKEYVEKFKKLYFEKYGIKVTDEFATQGMTDLVNLMRVLLKPDPEEVLENKQTQPSNSKNK